MQREIITEEIGNRLSKIAKKMGVQLHEVNELYEMNYVKLDELKTVGDIGKLAYNKVSNHYKRELRRKESNFEPVTKATSIIGFLAGTHGMWDKAEQVRKAAKRYIDKWGLEHAIDNQYVNDNNEILDRRAKIFGKDNPDYLEVLSPKLKVRSNTVIGFFRKNGDKNYYFTTMQTNDNKLALAWTRLKYFLPCQSFGIEKEVAGKEMRMNSSSADDTMSVFRAIDEEVDIVKVIEDTVKYTKIADVEKHYETYKDAWDRNIVIRGTVSWISDRETSWGAIYVAVADPNAGVDDTTQVRVLIPDHISIDFGEGSEIIVFGKTKRNMRRNEETDKWDVPGDVIVNVHGIYPLPGLTTPKEETEDEDENPIDGWFQ